MQEQAERPRAEGTANPQTVDAGTQAPDGGFAVRTPSISLPKGGGAIRGIGEKFAANPVTGTASLSVPIYTSPGRSGFGPQLSLSYDSGAGNGPFGFGWNLSLPSITRKTDKGLPKYQDADESDVFILSGAEDLVPALNQDGSRYEDDTTASGYVIHRYRPRIEGLFARIERWIRVSDGDISWRSISRDNITTWYGKTAESRIADPDDAGHVFSWLICESYDDKGNAIVYDYVAEDDRNVDRSRANERNRVRSANRYLKRVRYGNTPSRLVQPDLALMSWLFEVVFDYHFEPVNGEEHGQHYTKHETDPNGRAFVDASTGELKIWGARKDPFSRYRSGFEVRTYRLCHRVLMFHHFPNELGVADYLVRSTEFAYEESPVASFITAATQSGYVRQNDGTYLKKSLPPLEFEYSKPDISETVEEVDSESLENLPIGLDGSTYQWVDLDGEGLPGILTEQAGGWYYKRNLSPLPREDGDGDQRTAARFAPLETVATKPSLAEPGGQHRFLDLAGDGRQDVALLERPVPGFYERTDDEQWEPFKHFLSYPNVDWADPNLRFADLTGDGHADILITEHQAFTWYPSLAEEGFAPAEKARQALDEEKGPTLVFADGTQSIYLTDLSGDGLSDLARIRNGEVCYWPNLGYGRFGPKVTMDNSPRFDRPDQFNQQRIRLADIDGSGTTDILYLHHDRVDIYRNESGNRWGSAEPLTNFPRIDNLSSVMAVDLLGNGTACLVWSSPLPGDAGRQMQYIDLMGGQKPHLMIGTINNLGAETRVTYAPSTKFYLADQRDGRPWITKIPFPVHVVERVETYDHISRNRFVTRHAYHHGYFDGVEREFRGFGMVEQWDTEEFASLSEGGELPDATNIDEASHAPPVLTRTWFHTGSYLQRAVISRHFEREYFQGDPDAELLPDTVLPPGLTTAEEREACRTLKGSMLRQEVYARDGTDKEENPYAVTEQNFTIGVLQRRGGNRHAVFFTHPREAISYNYERRPADPRVAHTLTLEVDEFGNVLKDVAVGYGRRQPDPGLPLQADRDKQSDRLITYTENGVTNAIEAADDYRTPLPCETRTYELTGYLPTDPAARFVPADFVEPDPDNPGRLRHVFDGEINYEDQPNNGKQRRLIEHVRTLYRKDDLTAHLPLGEVEPLTLPGESYKLAFTPGLLAQVFRRDGQPLLSNPGSILGGQGADRGGYVVSQDLKTAGGFPDTDPDDYWWIPAGRVFLSPDSAHTAAQELAHAQSHFFLPHRYRDPFHTDAASTESVVTYDGHDLLIVETRDALDNVATAMTEDDAHNTTLRIDYRVLQPYWMTDPNGNRARVAFDAMGMVVGTAVMGKPGENLGDNLDGFDPDLTDAVIAAHLEDPFADPNAILARATTRLVYDLFAFHRSRGDAEPRPAVAYTLARETHDSDLSGGAQTKIQHSFSYSDGLGREIQQKIQAEPGPVEGLGDHVDPRWVGSGWTIFNNKGKPVRQYEPFFSQLPARRHQFEFGVEAGVSPVLFYDPVERVVATLHPNATYEKVVFDPWRQESWDVNDTVLGDPRTDADIGGYTAGYFAGLPASPPAPPWQTWHAQRQGGALGVQEQTAADKAAAHADTPTIAWFDTLGRPFLTLADNGPDPAQPGEHLLFATRVELDIEGNQREVIDALGRVVMRYDYYMAGPEEDEEGAGNRIHQASMEAGERWMLNDIAGNPIRAWDSRGHIFRTEYDRLRRPLRSFVTGADPDNPNRELLTDRLVYGEQHAEAELRNLRGTLHLLLDQAGAVTTEALDFKGNPLNASRRIANEYKQAIDWTTVDAALPVDATAPFDPAALEAALSPLVDADPYTTDTTYDALNRPVTMTTPHTPAMQPSVIRPGYNEANLLERMDANLRGATANGQPVWTPFVTNIDYDAKGQRQRIEYGTRDGAGISTAYTYDPDTFRLIHLRTTRNAAGFDTTDRPGEVQNLHYTYDPAGNITHIRDDAQQTVFFDNRRVEPSAEYIYDAIYRLIEATGREHLGQTSGNRNKPTPPDAFNGFHTRLLQPGDGNAMGTYIERFVYDAVGNFESMQHRGGDPADPGWTRAYAYNEASQLEGAKQSNRLTSTTVGAGPAEPYAYDIHGNITSMSHLPLMRWDYRDQLQATARQRVTDGNSPETTYYIYDSAGERMRKVTERQAAAGDTPTRMKERIYLGGFEIYREYNGDGATVTLERETLHVMDDEQRIALVETRTQGTDPAPKQLIRYQLGNHLGSASLELDDQAEVISYEEYTPYGSSSYQAVRSQTETPKRYRYTGMERDEESGLNYHGARYYAPWLGRWVNADPAGLVDGVNLFRYARNNPINLRDSTGKSPDPELKPFNIKGLGKGPKVHQMHFFPESLQRKLVPGWTRQLSYSLQEMTLEGTAKLNKSVDVKIARYLSGINKVEGPEHMVQIIQKVKRVWINAGIDHNIVNKWAKSAFDTANKIGILRKPISNPSARVLVRKPDGTTTNAIKPNANQGGFATPRSMAVTAFSIYELYTIYSQISEQKTFAGKAKVAVTIEGRLIGAAIGAAYGLESPLGLWGALLGGIIGGYLGETAVRETIDAVGYAINNFSPSTIVKNVDNFIEHAAHAPEYLLDIPEKTLKAFTYESEIDRELKSRNQGHEDSMRKKGVSWSFSF